MTAAEKLHSRAMLASLTVKAWSARKYDKKVTKETNEAHNADADAGRYNKKLLPGDAPSYKALTQHISQMRLKHYALTLPWSDEGSRVLTRLEYWHYADTMRQMFTEGDALLDAFVADYPQLREDARVKLNGMFDEEDYPRDIRKKYKFGITYDPIPTGGDWRVELPQEEIDMLSASTQNRVDAALAEAQADAVKRLHKVLAKMVERLGGEDTCDKCEGEGTTIETRKRPTKGTTVTCWICGGTGKVGATFRDTLVDNVNDLCDILARINLTDDPKLEEYRRMTAALASDTNVNELRDVPKIREDVAKQAQSILDAMTSTYGGSFFAPATKE